MYQRDKDGYEQPVAFFSRKLTPTESRWSTPDQELLALVECLMHWRHYCEGSPHKVIIRSDHANLRYINKTLNHDNRRQYGMLVKTLIFNYEIQHIPGKKNPADALSRLPQHRTNKSHLAPRVRLNFAPEEDSRVTLLTLESLTITVTFLPQTLKRVYLEDL